MSETRMRGAFGSHRVAAPRFREDVRSGSTALVELQRKIVGISLSFGRPGRGRRRKLLASNSVRVDKQVWGGREPRHDPENAAERPRKTRRASPIEADFNSSDPVATRTLSKTVRQRITLRCHEPI